MGHLFLTVPLISDGQHEEHVVQLRMVLYNPFQSGEAILPAQPDLIPLAILMVVSSSEDQLVLNDVGDEKQPEDQSAHSQKDPRRSVNAELDFSS